MRSTFFGLEMGRRALQSQQRALDVTGHNISNANTQGYTRQEALLQTTTPYTVPGFNKPASPGQVGSGVDVKEIRRIRDQFIDTQVRTENKSLGYWTVKKDALEKVEVILNEPSDSGLRSVLDKFWESWQELSKNPESISVRSVVRQRGLAVAETFNHLDKLYRDLQLDLNETINVKVNEVNSVARQIADINTQILSIEGTGDNANDLRDKRDSLIDQLSKIADVHTYENSLGVVNVRIGGSEVVVNGQVSELAVRKDNTTGYNNVVWADTALPITLSDGELKGLIESRGYTDPVSGKFVGTIPSLRDDLNLMAKTVIEETNAFHKVGYNLDGLNEGHNFFVPVEDISNGITIASGMKLSAEVEGNLNKIAAATDNTPGNGGNALKIAQLKHQMLVNITNSESVYDAQWTRDDKVINSAGVEQSITPATMIFGGAFAAADFNPNAALVINQNGKQISINLTDGVGAGIYAGDFNQLATDITTLANAAGMKVKAQVVQDETGKYRLAIEATDYGDKWAVNVQEQNFKPNTTFGFEDVQSSTMLMKETSVLRADGVTKIDIVGLGGTADLREAAARTTSVIGGLFNIGPTGDFLNNAAITIQQGSNSFDIPLTDAAGLDLATGTFGNTVGGMVDYINNQAALAGMDIFAQLVPSESDPTKFMIQIKSATEGVGKEVRVLEKNFKNVATFGFVNPSNTGTVDDYYRAQVGKLGVASQEASRMVDNQTLLVEQLDQRRQSMSGVSLDEEMTNMMKFQHAYNAAAKVVNAFDEMLDTIINHLGSGR